jgi:hypothetical protein
LRLSSPRASLGPGKGETSAPPAGAWRGEGNPCMWSWQRSARHKNGLEGCDFETKLQRSADNKIRAALFRSKCNSPAAAKQDACVVHLGQQPAKPSPARLNPGQTRSCSPCVSAHVQPRSHLDAQLRAQLLVVLVAVELDNLMGSHQVRPERCHNTKGGERGSKGRWGE